MVVFLKVFLSFYPPFNYTKFFTSISQHAGNHFDLSTRKWEAGSGYNMSVFMEDIRGSLRPLSSGGYTRYSDFLSMVILFLDCLFFVVLTWYFDHIVESNRGRNDPLLFPLKKVIEWLRKGRKNKEVIDLGIEHIKNVNFIIQ
jgi:hypothetical protein